MSARRMFDSCFRLKAGACPAAPAAVPAPYRLSIFSLFAQLPALGIGQDTLARIAERSCAQNLHRAVRVVATALDAGAAIPKAKHLHRDDRRLLAERIVLLLVGHVLRHLADRAGGGAG